MMTARRSPSDSPQLDLLGGDHAAPVELHRLFFALMPDDATRAQLQQAAVALKAQQASLRARWIDPARYHATLHFLGDHPMLRQDIVEAAKVAGDALRAVPFDWVLDFAASFHGREPPCVLRGSIVPEPMPQLWQRLREALIRAGQGGHMERTFTPHVTVAYSRGGMLETTPIEPVHWRVDRLALIHSVVGRGEYQTLYSWVLVG
ncbi:RNA 2',3'-cyclic phosphodiesterase [Dyella subtropica]|uniref:RNA 2',3'-cyclic phosphodiesterase n=1 Tax=Dyella subtropica TaxID=2992127 RepID=UPI002259AA31|nr:RNA 2',3'-cyclic phosphodiesterase [Dyella subtropica]